MSVEKALSLAYSAHLNQIDKAGKPYILHPMYVALQMESDHEKIVALLHDVLEDTDIPIETVIELFGQDVANDVWTLAKKHREPYFTYIYRVGCFGSTSAIKVKIADLKHNSDLSRIVEPTENDIKRRDKYLEAIKVLTGEKSIYD